MTFSDKFIIRFQLSTLDGMPWLATSLRPVILLHSASVRPVHCRILSLHCNISRPRLLFPFTMPSSKSSWRLSCLITCRNWRSSFFNTLLRLWETNWPKLASTYLCLLSHIIQLSSSILLCVDILNASSWFPDDVSNL